MRSCTTVSCLAAIFDTRLFGDHVSPGNSWKMFDVSLNISSAFMLTSIHLTSHTVVSHLANNSPS